MGARDLRRGRGAPGGAPRQSHDMPPRQPHPGRAGPGTLRPARLSLADVEPGETVRLERITEEVELDMASLEYLDEHGLIPGRSARVRGRAPDGTLTLEVDGSTVALGPAICQQMFVAARLTTAPARGADRRRVGSPRGRQRLPRLLVAARKPSVWPDELRRGVRAVRHRRVRQPHPNRHVPSPSRPRHTSVRRADPSTCRRASPTRPRPSGPAATHGCACCSPTRSGRGSPSPPSCSSRASPRCATRTCRPTPTAT